MDWQKAVDACDRRVDTSVEPKLFVSQFGAGAALDAYTASALVVEVMVALATKEEMVAA